MGYRWNKLTPFYLEFTDYNLKNVYSVVKRKSFGKKRYKFYDRRLIEGLYKFGFYKDIINGELAVIDAGIKKIQIMKDEISGTDFDINLSWVFATKHLETQNTVYGYEYKSIYNLKLLCLGLLRLENRNKSLRSQVKLLNLKPSLKLGLSKKGLVLSKLVFDKRMAVKSLLVNLLHLWYSKKLPLSGLRLWNFYLRKIRIRLRNLTILYFYYKLNYVKIFEALFWPVKSFSKKRSVKLFQVVKKPPRWMLKRFGLKIFKKWVKGLFFISYVNLACGLWGSPQPISFRKHDAKTDLFLEIINKRSKRKDFMRLQNRDFLLEFANFFRFLPVSLKLVKRRGRLYSFKFYLNKMLSSIFMYPEFYRFFFIQSLFNAVYSLNIFRKNFAYELFSYFVCVFSENKKKLHIFKNILYFFAKYELFIYLSFFPNRVLELFLHKERLYLYNLGSGSSVNGLNSYPVPLFKSSMRKFVCWLERGSKKFLAKTSKREWWYNKKYSWFLRKKTIMRRLIKIAKFSRRFKKFYPKKRLKRYRVYFKWLSLEKRRFATIYKPSLTLIRRGQQNKINKKMFVRKKLFKKYLSKNIKLSVVKSPVVKLKDIKSSVVKSSVVKSKDIKSSVVKSPVVKSKDIKLPVTRGIVKTLGPDSKQIEKPGLPGNNKPKMSVSQFKKK